MIQVLSIKNGRKESEGWDDVGAIGIYRVASTVTAIKFSSHDRIT
jgi:hypothetical protein